MREIRFLNIIDGTSMQSVIRLFEILKSLNKENIYAIILTQKLKNKDYFNEFFFQEINQNTRIYKIPFLRIKEKIIFFNYLIQFFEWIPFAYYKSKRIIKQNKNIKFINASGPQFFTHVIGYLLKRKFHLPLVIEYRDPWSSSPYIEKIYERGIFKLDLWLYKKISLLLEKRILLSADFIITISQALKEHLKHKFSFIKKKNLISIPNGLNFYSCSDFSLREKKKIVFIYTGSLYIERSVIPLLKIISNLKKKNFFEKINFSIKIFGNYNKDLLINIINQWNIADLIFLGDLISRNESLKKINNCDLPIHIGENLDYPTIAFKVWDYLSCRKKILYIGRKNSYTSKFLEDNKFGIVIPINNLKKGEIILKELIEDIFFRKFNNQIDEKDLFRFLWKIQAKKFYTRIIKKFIT